MSPGRFTLFGLPYFCGRRGEALAWLLSKDRQPRYACVANVHTAVTGLADRELAAAQKGAGLCVPDGRPLIWAAWMKGYYGARQVRGADLIRLAADKGRRRKLAHYYFGGEPGMAKAAAARLKRDYPGMKVAGAESPPFRPLTAKEISGLAGRLKRSRAGLLWVALGAPKQEKWMARHYRLFPCTSVGIGGALPLYAGLQREAPAWTRRAGLEWAFRLVQEPGRLWKRYVVTNPLFVLCFFLDYFGLGFERPRLPGCLLKWAGFLFIAAWPCLGRGHAWLAVAALGMAHLGQLADRFLTAKR